MLLAGCFGPDLESEIACGPSSLCPPGYGCESGVCVRPGEDPDPDPDADGGVTPANCRAAEGLVDDFSGDQPGPPWRSGVTGGADVSQAGGVLEIDPDDGNGYNEGYYETRETYDLTDSHMSVEVTDMVNFETGAGAFMSAYSSWPNPSRYVGVEQIDGELRFSIADADGGTSSIELVDAIPYDGKVHRFWRIRGDAQTAYAETSADGDSWEVFSSADLSDLDELLIGIGVWSNDTTTAGSASFDNFNGGGTPTLPDCDRR